MNNPTHQAAQDAATVATRTAKPPPRKTARPHPAKSQRAPTGVLSFVATLEEHERAVIGAGLAILAKHLRQPGAMFAAPDAVKDYLRLHIGGESREVFAVLYLDAQNALIETEFLAVGTLTQTSVYPREVARAALAHGAAAVILGHNHPSGSTQPSRADESHTQTIKAALSLLDVRVTDHIIVTRSDALSMAEQGLL